MLLLGLASAILPYLRSDPRQVELMRKNVRKVEDQVNDTVAQEDTVNDDIVSVDSSDDADDSNEIQILESSTKDSATVDDTCNDKPLATFDDVFLINYRLVNLTNSCVNDLLLYLSWRLANMLFCILTQFSIW